MEAGRETRELIQQAQRGDDDAADALVELYRERIELYVRRRLGPKLRARVEVDDVADEAFLRAFRSIGRFSWQGEESFLKWVCRIAECLMRDLARRHALVREHPFLRDPPVVDPSPSTSLRREERFDRLQTSFESLSPEHREVVTLVCLQGLRVREAADRIGKTPGAIRNLLLRALRKLRGSFGDTESCHLPDRLLTDEETEDEPGASER